MGPDRSADIATAVQVKHDPVFGRRFWLNPQRGRVADVRLDVIDAARFCRQNGPLGCFLWRFSKFWRGARTEIPWVDRSPAEIVRDNFRLTIQPFDGPSDPDDVGSPAEMDAEDAGRREVAVRGLPRAPVGDDLLARCARPLSDRSGPGRLLWVRFP